MNSATAEICAVEPNLVQEYPPLLLIQGIGNTVAGDDDSIPDTHLLHTGADDETLSVDIALLPEDKELRRRTDQTIQFIGSTAVEGKEVASNRKPEIREKPSFNTLMEAFHQAVEGNQEAIDYIFENVLADMKERTWKAGIVLKTRLRRDKNGEHVQHGQNVGTVHTNTFRYAAATPEMHNRARHEAYNRARTQYYDREGTLEDNWLVVFSLCAVNKTDEELTEMGFFEDTKSCAIQAVTVEGNDLPLESGFVAGVARPKAERHDLQTIIEIGATFGVDYRDMSPAEIIGRPLLIPKKFMTNGVVDIVKLYDKLAGGTFFGEDKPVQDYQEYLKQCERRDAELIPTAQLITNQLIGESGAIITPQAAIGRLHELSEYHMVKRSVTDKTINPRVFGEVSAGYIEQARLHHEQGNEEMEKVALQRAQDTAVSDSCPTALKSEHDSGQSETELAQRRRSRKGKIRCVKCREPVSKLEATKNPGRLCCPNCKYEIDICTGEVHHESRPPRKEKFDNIASINNKSFQKAKTVI